MTHNNNITTENLVPEFRNGNKAALSFIYDAYSGALYGILLKMIRDEELCQDLLQETFIKIWKNHEKFDPEKGTIYTWMLNLTRNNCIDYLRSKRNKNQQQNRELDSLVYGLESSSGFNPDHIGVKDMLNQLPAEQKEIIILSYFEGYTQKEISEDFDIPLGTVKSRAKAAMDKLRKIMSAN